VEKKLQGKLFVRRGILADPVGVEHIFVFVDLIVEAFADLWNYSSQKNKRRTGRFLSTSGRKRPLAECVTMMAPPRSAGTDCSNQSA